MVTLCWAAKGGSGTTVVVAATRICRRATGPARRPRRRPPLGARPRRTIAPGHPRLGAVGRHAEPADRPRDPGGGRRVLVCAGLARAPADAERWQALGRGPRRTRRHRRRRRRHRAAAGRPRRRRRPHAARHPRLLPGAAARRARSRSGRQVSCSSRNPAGPCAPRDVERRSARRSWRRIALDPAVARAVDAGLLAARLPRLHPARAPERGMNDLELVDTLCRRVADIPGDVDTVVRRHVRAVAPLADEAQQSRSSRPPSPGSAGSASSTRCWPTATSTRSSSTPAARSGSSAAAMLHAAPPLPPSSTSRRASNGSSRRSGGDSTAPPDRRRPAPRRVARVRRPRAGRRRWRGAVDPTLPPTASLPLDAFASARRRRAAHRVLVARGATSSSPAPRRRARPRCSTPLLGLAAGRAHPRPSRTPPNCARPSTTSCGSKPARPRPTDRRRSRSTSSCARRCGCVPTGSSSARSAATRCSALVQAMNTGHDGSLSTCHANGPIDALLRLETLVMQAAPSWPLAAIRAQLSRSIDVIVHVARTTSASRQIVDVVEVVPGDGTPAVRPLVAGSDVIGVLERRRA